jgi:hypothetical protein
LIFLKPPRAWGRQMVPLKRNIKSIKYNDGDN